MTTSEWNPGISDRNGDEETCPSPECGCPGCKEEFGQEAPEGFISKADASRIMRVMIRIEQQIMKAYDSGRIEDGNSMARLFGGLQYHQFETSCMGEL